MSMIKPFACLLTLLFVYGDIAAQVYGRHTAAERADTIITAFDDNNDSTVYTAMQRIISGMQPISYLSPVLLRFLPQDRIIPLRFGEGQNGYVLEGWVDQSFTLLQGRSQMDHFSQTARVSVRYAPALRMTKDNSKNLIPSNQKVGIQIDKVLWDSYTQNFFSDRRLERFEYADDNEWLRRDHRLHMLHATLNAMHYSNGQGKGVYASASDSVLGRNDYLKGDFSTNFINVSLIYNYYNVYLLTGGIGFQYDGQLGTTFTFIDEQRFRYGRTRLTGLLQLRSRPQPNIFRRYFTIKDIYHQRSYLVRRVWEHRVRIEMEYILGDLHRFKRGRDYRFNAHVFYELNPLRARTVGFMAHLYYGRDYMNIRYDDIVLGGMLGITFSLTKYTHPRFNPNALIVREISQSKFETIRQSNRSRRMRY